MPATKKPILTLSVLAAAALSEAKAVSYTGTVPSAGATAFGFATEDAAINTMAAVDVQGTTIAISGAAIAVGAQLEIGTSGRVITKDTGVVVARALQAASAADEKIEVLLLPN